MTSQRPLLALSSQGIGSCAFQQFRRKAPKTPPEREAKNTIKQGKTPKGQMVPISRVYNPPPHKTINAQAKIRSGKLTLSSSKAFLNRALFAYENGHFASGFLLLGIGLLEASKKANLSFKSPSPKPHFNRTGSVFALPKKGTFPRQMWLSFSGSALSKCIPGDRQKQEPKKNIFDVFEGCRAKGSRSIRLLPPQIHKHPLPREGRLWFSINVVYDFAGV